MTVTNVASRSDNGCQSRVRLSYRQHVSRLFQLKAEQEPSSSSSTLPKVLVGGGTGFVGGVLCQSLRQKGYSVTVISRSEGASRLTWDELKAQGLPENTKAVVNLAGQNILATFTFWTESFQRLVRDSRIQTSLAIAEAIQKSPKHKRPDVFVQITGVGYYQFGTTEAQDEYTPGVNKDFFARLVADWEAAAKLPSDCDDVRQVYIRSGVVLGRQGGMVQQLFWPFFFGVGGRTGSGDQVFPWIHVKDLVGVIEHCIENPKVKGVLNGVAPEVITNLDFAQAFAGALNRPCFFPTPGFLMKMVFGSERASMILGSMKVVPTRTIETGYVFKYGTIREAAKEFSVVSHSG
ncbi:hypothetical protein TCAL_01998 [Tigriopus californicus]|uniref:DUF1731 domain-containing protein n=1 Tax=Tigriopus californicus TaxID=6832 RepID=A0A553PNE0_TIGCA|nr:epimerase family protein SDR39U1-like [Tigriopus californicus]TRY79201.1 hypothetical protein TCAL_01998 [Tigriopus californicus]|eukprot:TCALIF_01998-PA protein Name:"Similar to SDR39U1 Epimerase family protein SDR39U1 (Bos taurus)" AED:0.03 eAED:0.03 QI:60/1/1/1/1/1/5/245/348